MNRARRWSYIFAAAVVRLENDFEIQKNKKTDRVELPRAIRKAMMRPCSINR
jgi:hypothetical protein